MILNLLASSYPKLAYVCMAMLGASIGSFAGVIIFRMPLGLSIVTPSSFCASCEKNLKLWHKVPILSCLLLRGSCAFCRKPFGYRLLLIEIIFMLCLLALYAKFGLSFALIERFSFAFVLICLAYIDLDTYYLPYSLLLSLMLLGFGFLALYYFYPSLYVAPGKPWLLGFMRFGSSQIFSLSDKLAGALVGFAFFSLINLCATYVLRKSKGLLEHEWAMGFGDPLLLMAIALFVGLSNLVIVVFVASALGSMAGISLRLLKHSPEVPSDVKEGALPYGPFLALAALYVYLF